MTDWADWADEIAHGIYVKCHLNGDIMSFETEELIRDALRQARIDALEEAAKLFEPEDECDCAVCQDMRDQANAIRALKDKQP